MQTCREAQSNLFRLAFVLLHCALLLILNTGCGGCSAEKAVATLIKKTGGVDRSVESSADNWTLANIDQAFQIGDAVRTQKNSGAELSLDDGSILGLEEETVIRFLDKEPGSDEQSFDLQLGTASLEAPEAGMSLRTAFGMAKLEGGAKVTLRRSGESLRYEVLVGRAKLESADGEKLTVEAGQRVEVSLGQASLELLESKEEEEARKTKEKADAEIRAEEKADEIRRSRPITASVKGSRVKVLQPGDSSYAKLAPGEATLKQGSTLKVGSGSAVVLTQGSDQAILAAGGTYVIGGRQLVTAKSGTVTVTAKGMIRVAVPGGVIITREGTATIKSVRKGTEVKALSGVISLKGKSTETITAGEKGLIGRDGEVSVKGRGVSRTDFRLGVGQSIVIHDPAPPTAIRFLFVKKCEQGVIRLKGSRKAIPGESYARGKKSTALLIGPGAVKYSLHCVDEDGKEGPATARGSIAVMHDAGSRPMPKKAPSTTVDVNGRGYTVLYQHQLPRITLRWSSAPAGASDFKLHVSGHGGKKTLSAGSASYTFRSGALGGGKHTVYFTGGGRVSRKSTVSIRFDNATPTASLATPVHSGAGRGGAITVSGTALPGWSASVDGRPLEQDGNNRFNMKTNMPGDGRALAVHLSHPTRGSHVYLRRPAGAR